ncbi:MAG: hypothetical protein ACXV7J_07040 [Methylomonas sp.]
MKILNFMKAIANIQNFMLGFPVQKLANISRFPMTINKYKGFGRESVEPGIGNIWRGKHVA